MLHKTRWYAFLRRHCRSDDIALEGAADEDTTPTEPGQFEMSEIAANGTIGAEWILSCTHTCVYMCILAC